MTSKRTSPCVDKFDADTYPILVSTHDWLLQDQPRIAVDGARLYVISKSEGIRGLSHSSANLKEDKRRCVEFCDPQWSDYLLFNSSNDGRYVSFSHKYKVSTAGHGKRTGFVPKWLIYDDELEGGKPKYVMFGDEDMPCVFLSRDGQTLFSYSCLDDNTVTRVYQIMEEVGKSPAAFMKLELNGWLRAVSGKSNRGIVANLWQFGIYDIGKVTSRLVCQIDLNVYFCECALNENGSEAAFVTHDKLRIMRVDKVVGNKINQPAIVTLKIPESLGWIDRMVYSDENKLHVLHKGGKVSLFDPLTKTLIPLEVPQEEQDIVGCTISPNASYTATIQCVGEEEKDDGKCLYRTIVKRKELAGDLRSVFGCGADKVAKQS